MTGWGAIGEDESEAGYRRVGERGATLFFHISPTPSSLGSEAPRSPSHSLNIFLFIFLTSAYKEDRSQSFPSRQELRGARET